MIFSRTIPSARSLTAILLFLTVITATAAHLSPSEALERALNSSKAFPTILKSAPADRFSLKKEVLAQSGTSGCYVFSIPGSFIIVAADDRCEPVLAYGDTAPDDWDSLSPATDAWLKMYAEEIDHINQITEAPFKESPEKARAKINPLLSTKWDQWSPYNDKCPIFTGNVRCVTGCVATAAAQLMYKFRKPAKGTGSHSYTDDIKGRTVTLSANFGATSYDWANMANTFSSKSSTAAKNAISTLMAHLGVATEMDYAIGGQNASGTPVVNAGSGLINYFGYNKEMATLEKKCHTATEWEDALHGELTAGRAVLYSGGTSASSHAFVCDGYDGAGKYHFNWGWGGQADGYFSLSALKPATMSGTKDYTPEQLMMIGVKPAGGEHRRANLIARNGVKSDMSMGRRGGSFTIAPDGNDDAAHVGFYNYTLGPSVATIQTGANVVNGTTGVTTFVSGRTDELRFLYGISGIPLPTASLDPGTYNVIPAARESSDGGKVFKIQLTSTLPRTFELVVGKTFVKLYNSNTSTYTLFASNFNLPSAVSSGQSMDVTATVSSRYAGYNGNIRLQFYDFSSLSLTDEVTLSDNVTVGKNGETALSTSVTVPYLPAGNYIVALADERGIPFAETGEIAVEGSTPTFTVDSFHVSPSPIHSDDPFTVTGYLTALDGRYDGTIRCRLQSQEETIVAESSDRLNVTLKPDSRRYFSFSFEPVAEGQYDVVLFDDASGAELTVIGQVTVQNFKLDISNVEITGVTMAHRDFVVEFDVSLNERTYDYLLLRFVDASTGQMSFCCNYGYCSLSSLTPGVSSRQSLEISDYYFDIEPGTYNLEFITGPMFGDLHTYPSHLNYGPVEISDYICDPVLTDLPYFDGTSPVNTIVTGNSYTLRVPVRKLTGDYSSVHANICRADNGETIYSAYLSSTSPRGTEELLENPVYFYDTGYLGKAYLNLDGYNYTHDYAPLWPERFNHVPLLITDRSGLDSVFAKGLRVVYDPTTSGIRITGAEPSGIVSVSSMTGTIIISDEVSTSDFDIDVSDAPNGVYIVAINGKSFKIIK